MRVARKAPFVAVSLSLALLAAACGSDKKSSDTTVAASTETTVAAETTVATGAEPTVAAETTVATGTETTVAADTTVAAGTETTVVGAVGTETTVAGGAPVAAGGPINSDLKAAGCPDPLVIQTDWYPEVDHSEAYALAAPGGTVDKAKGSYTAALIDPRNGKDTGVKVQVRNGGPATQFTQPSWPVRSPSLASPHLRS